MSKRLSLLVVIFFCTVTNFTSCNVINQDHQKTSNSKTTAQVTKKDNEQKLKIKIDCYKSDKMKNMGYDINVQGKRFPVPTTLNELGKDWSFDSGNINDRESGAYDGQRYWRVGNFYTSQWYEAGTRKKIYDTGAILCYKEVPVLSVGLDDFRENGKYTRNSKISSISDSTHDQEEGHLKLSINGIHVGDILDLSIEQKFGKGLWETNKYNRVFRKRKNGISISFVCSLKSASGRVHDKKYNIHNINIGPYKKRSKTPMGSE